MVKCGIANDVLEQEQQQGTTFKGEELDTNLKLQILKKAGDTVTTFLEDPRRYLENE